jgi:hypothetical protein
MEHGGLNTNTAPTAKSDPEFRDLLHTWFKEANAAFPTILNPPKFHLIEKRP